MKEKIKIKGYVECSDEEFKDTPKKNKLSVCFGDDYTFLQFRRKKK